jgi:hydroxymethylglutaryl-CoA reductase
MSNSLNYVIASFAPKYLPNSRFTRKHIENPLDFAQRFVQAVQIAEVEPFRAVTHNKGIMNGMMP